MPFFSIIIPTYNRASKVANTLEQLKAQTFADYEVLIVEDVYNNGAFFSSLLSNDKLIYSFLDNKKNVTVKRNLGAAKASGKYLIFLDDDDAVANNWLADFADVLAESKADIAFCAVEVLQSSEKKKLIFPENAYQDERDWGIFLAGAFAVSKELFETVGGYDEMLRYGENTELGIRLKSIIKSKSFINNINLSYTASENGGSKNIQNTFIANNHILAKHKNWFQQNPILHFNYLSVLGIISFKLKKTKLAKKYLYEALAIRYFNPKAWFRCMISLFPFIAKKVWHSK